MIERQRPARVSIVEVGPRDGLQNEKALIPTAGKIAFVDALAAAGHTRIEVSAFVSPARVPQMADAAEVFAGLTRRAGVCYSALVPNLTGLARATDAGADAIAIFAAASETFSQRNLGQSIAGSMRTYEAVCAEAARVGLRVRAYLSTVFGCPFEGEVPVALVADLARQLLEMGACEVALSDTIGVAHPDQVTHVVRTLSARIPLDQLALHLHDTRGTALVNVYAGLAAGVTTFDSSAGGLGGCPFAPGAAGNLATEDLLYLLERMRIETGVRIDEVAAATSGIEPLIGHPLPSRVFGALRSGTRG
jgi:isopropylmalate/homocitrate/citramalate synthase